MRPARMRFTIGRLMITVAIAASLFAFIGVPDTPKAIVAMMAATALIIVPNAIACLSPLLARPGHRLLAATWVAALGTLSFPWTLHAAWGIARGFLGHSPGMTDNEPVINLLGAMAGCSYIFSLLSPIVCLAFTIYINVNNYYGSYRGRWVYRIIPVVLMPLVVYPVLVFLTWDPLTYGSLVFGVVFGKGGGA
jgi:hypothetical protein